MYTVFRIIYLSILIQRCMMIIIIIVSSIHMTIIYRIRIYLNFSNLSILRSLLTFGYLRRLGTVLGQDWEDLAADRPQLDKHVQGEPSTDARCALRVFGSKYFRNLVPSLKLPRVAGRHGTPQLHNRRLHFSISVRFLIVK
jgi:hypothetical protein